MGAGHPPLYATVEELEAKIQEYFESCKPEVMYVPGQDGAPIIATDKQGKPVIIFHAMTMSGLAYYLGFKSRQSLYDNDERDDEFSYVIKRARLRLEAYAEEQLYIGGKPIGAIFALKNMGWRDRTEIEATGTLKIEWPEALKKELG